MIITYYWPPVSSPGVQRWVKFAKYFRNFGLPLSVCTVSNPSAPNRDNTLLQDIPNHINVLYTKSLEPIGLYNLFQGKKGNTTDVGLGDIKNPDSTIKKIGLHLRSNVFIPDAKIGWYYYQRKKILKWIKQNKIDVLITTGPPHTTHLFGLYSKIHSNLKWIADFRDPWTEIYYEALLKRSEKSFAKNKNLETSVLNNADLVVTVSTGMKHSFQKKAKKCLVIPNGYDEEDFHDSNIRMKSDTFKILYTGNLKANQNINAFWKAIKKLQNDNTIRKSLIVEIIGNSHSTIKKTIEDYGLKDIVTFKPFVTHDKVIKLMVNANLLWLPIPQVKNNQQIITGKIFEYLASQTPILAIGPLDGEASLILKKCNREPMLAYTNSANIQKRIEHHIKFWKQHDHHSSKEVNDNHKIYSRQNLAKMYCNAIFSLT